MGNELSRRTFLKGSALAAAIGAAFKATGVPREELFITCKLFRPYANEQLAGKAYYESLK